MHPSLFLLFSGLFIIPCPHWAHIWSELPCFCQYAPPFWVICAESSLQARGYTRRSLHHNCKLQMI